MRECKEKGSFRLKRTTFCKTDRIRNSLEYISLSKYGIRHYSEYYISVSRKNQLSDTRLGITVSRKVGDAVTRNRIKRIIREFFRLNRDLLPVHLDINIIVRQPCGKITPTVMRKHLRHCFQWIAARPEYHTDREVSQK